MGLAPSSLAQWVGGIATSAAVIVALFKDPIFRYFRQPRLTVRLLPESPDCLLSPFTARDKNGAVKWTGQSYWLRLWIQNEGVDPAAQVQVFISKLYRRGADGKFAVVSAFPPMNLRWSNARDWNNPEIFAASILQKPLGKHCDLCSISDPAYPADKLEGYPDKCIANLQTEVFPSSNVQRLSPGEYVIEVIVGAANAKPVVAYVRLNLKGGWSTDFATMFREHLGVEILKKLP